MPAPKKHMRGQPKPKPWEENPLDMGLDGEDYYKKLVEKSGAKVVAEQQKPTVVVKEVASSELFVYILNCFTVRVSDRRVEPTSSD